MEQKQSSTSIRQQIKDIFFVDDNSLGKAIMNAEKAETLMQNMSKEGWKIVSVSPCEGFSTGGKILITFEREV